MRFGRLRNERGAVMVITALALFGMLSVMTFAIDVSHWFAYSRNLQNRADAAALAAGDAYGNVCFTSDFGTPQTGAQSGVGKWAQLYSGAGVNEPSGHLPYTDDDVTAATNWPVATNGYINNTKPASTVDSPLTLRAGSLSDYFVRLNADNYATKGGTDFSHGDFCAWDPTYDVTDKQCYAPSGPHGLTTGACAVGPMVDVKVTQRQLPNFIPIFNIHPNISAHARIALQGIASEKGVRPLAIGDASYTPCVTANFLNNDGTLIASETMKRIGTSDTWTSLADAKQIQIPSGSTNPVTVQFFLNDCNSTSPSGTTYDYFDAGGKERTIGLAYISNWGNPTGTVPGGGRIATGGVTLLGNAGTSCGPYFQSSSGSCPVDVDAHVEFPAPAAGVTYFVRAVDAGGTLACNPAGAQSCISRDLMQQGNTTEWQSAITGGGPGPFTFGSNSGPHNIDIWTSQLGGSVGGNNCKASGSGNQWDPSNSKCWTDLHVQQRAFSGINGTNACNNPPFDTGPLQWINVGTTDGLGATAGANAYAQGATPHLYVTAQVQGLANSAPTDPDICLRVAVQTQHATGFIDCGQGNGGNQDIATIVNGCPVPPGLQINTRVQADGSLTCTPTITPWDCVGNDPGQSPPVLKAFDQLIGKGPAGAPDSCWDNNWGKKDAQGNLIPITLADPRAIAMVITAPINLQDQNGAAGQKIPIRNFAVFYVTGWSSKASTPSFPNGGVKGCTNNDTAPSGIVDGEIWGHWTSLQVPSGLGTGNGMVCVPNQFGNCVAQLTR